MPLFDTSELNTIIRIPWSRLEPGMVLLGGIQINGIIPEEFRDYPVLTKEMIDRLTRKYQFISARTVLAAIPRTTFNGAHLAQQIRESRHRVERINTLRKAFSSLKERLITKEYVEENYLIKDSYNSFTHRLGKESPVPSFFSKPELSLTMGNVLGRDLEEKWRFPDDIPVNLHLVIDYSKSMKSGGKLSLTLQTVDFFQKNFLSILENTSLDLYAFSDKCRHIESPFGLQGSPLPMKETNYSAFIKKVLHHRDRDKYNKVLLFTDGKSSDGADALKFGKLFKKNRVDFTQIVLAPQKDMIILNDQSLPPAADNTVELESLDKGQYTVPSESEREEIQKETFESFTRFANSAGANQIILKYDDALNAVSVESYDRYLGLLTLQNSY